MSRLVPKGLAQHLLRHPLDVAPLLRSAWTFRRVKWWVHAPFLPLPGPTYWEFRMTTAYGDPHAVPSALEAVEAARWTVRSRTER
jgi:hypothetical protein